MGASGSNHRLSKEERQDRNNRRQQKIRDNVERNARSSAEDGVSRTEIERYRHLREKEIAHYQLIRGDQSFTKTDLVAILIRLRETRQSRGPDPIDMYHSLTVKDLIVLIRGELYSPEKKTDPDQIPALPSGSEVILSRRA